MAQAAAQMVTESIKSFVDKDLKLAHKVMKDDDVVDDHFDEVKKDIINLIRDGVPALSSASTFDDSQISGANWGSCGQHR